MENIQERCDCCNYNYWGTCRNKHKYEELCEKAKELGIDKHIELKCTDYSYRDF